MRISDWSSDVCSSDLCGMFPQKLIESTEINGCVNDPKNRLAKKLDGEDAKTILNKANPTRFVNANTSSNNASKAVVVFRSEEHTSELQSLMRISYAVFCLKKKKNNTKTKKKHK